MTTYSSGLVQALQLINEEIKLCYGLRGEMSYNPTLTYNWVSSVVYV
jgi:hypothetical protein